MVRIMNETTKPLLKSQINSIYRSFDTIGDIAVVKIPENLHSKKILIGKALLKDLKQIRVVMMQSGPVTGELRKRDLKYLAGERRTKTLHKEYGCSFIVDPSQVYFSPRLSTERMRIAMLVEPGERILNMFAGVGPFSILIAKQQPLCSITSIDINPNAHRMAKENARINNVSNQIEEILGNAKEEVDNIRGKFTRVLMPLPESAMEYLDYGIKALKEEGGWLHVYTHLHASTRDEALIIAKNNLDERIRGRGRSQISRIVKEVGPGWFQVVVDAEIS